MNYKKISAALVINRMPSLGVLLFVMLYMYSSTLYPGGSQADPMSQGFDWINNYWCNLLNQQAINGDVNPARPVAMVAMLLLCGSVFVFLYQFSQYVVQNQVRQNIIKIGGMLSMFFAVLIFTAYHDEMIVLSSFFGLFVVISITIEIYTSPWIRCKISGVLCLLLLAVNNYIYYSQQYIAWLPFIQKITFLIVLIWILALNNELRKKIKKTARI